MTATTTEKTGKGKYGDRETVLCYALDADKLNEQYARYSRAVYGDAVKDEEMRQIRPGEYVALRVKDEGRLPGREWMEDRKGSETWAIILTEGVGFVADNYNCIEVTVLGNFGQNTRFLVHDERVPEFFTGEMVDLADHIRVFGDRLERNFNIWAGHAV